jgi:16S rRNA processing protein RimM
MVWVDGRAYAIERRAGHDRGVILRLAEIGDRGVALSLRGKEITVPRDTGPALGEDEWWAEDLEGCTVADGDRQVGVVTALSALPSCEVLEVKRTDGSDLLVPLVSDAVRSVDIDAKRIDIDLAFLGEDG